MIATDTMISATPAATGCPWEIGGDFPLMPLPQSPFTVFPEPSVYFALGRHCVVALLEVLEPKRRRLWIPSFFCPDVVGFWAEWFKVETYRDDPRWPAPDWCSLSPDDSDIVIAVNYFASRRPDPWNDWHRRNGCILVEDHSHDPVSEWALHSQADYVFSSLRKTLPIPDGAILWSPRKHYLPGPGKPAPAPGVNEKRRAMGWKAAYLQSEGQTNLKRKYRSLLGRSEVKLEKCRPVAISPFSQHYVSGGVPELWRNLREKNIQYLIEQLERWRIARPLFVEWPEGSVPLAVVLVFKTAAERDRYRSLLSTYDIYCPIHWVAQDGPPSHKNDLSSRVLTIPADQRYTVEDMKKAAQILFGIDRASREG